MSMYDVSITIDKNVEHTNKIETRFKKTYI